MVDTSYFTRAEFRQVTADITSPYKFRDDDIDRGQDQVIDHLERWASSAWPNVVARGTGNITASDTTLTLTSGTFSTADVGKTVRIVGAGIAGANFVTAVLSFSSATAVELTAAAGTTVTGAVVYLDGDGTAARPRVRTENIYDVGFPYLTTDYAPVIAFQTLSLGDTPTAITEYETDLEVGLIRWGTRRISPPEHMATITYEYGYTACPWAVKRACIKATQSLLLGEEDRSKLPPNTSNYSTGNIAVVLRVDAEPRPPWPWDEASSDAMQTYWGPSRPTRFVTV